MDFEVNGRRAACPGKTGSAKSKGDGALASRRQHRFARALRLLYRFAVQRVVLGIRRRTCAGFRQQTLMLHTRLADRVAIDRPVRQRLAQPHERSAQTTPQNHRILHGQRDLSRL